MKTGGMKTGAKKAGRAAHRADRRLSRKATASARDSRAVKVAAAIGEVADQPPLIALSLATIAAGAALRDPLVARAGIRMIGSHLLATAVKTAIKRRVDRTRPEAAGRGDRYTLEPGGDNGHDLASFPSGHTAGIVAVTRSLARDMPATAPYGAAAALGVAAIQLPNARHYASDVAAGAAIGLAAEWLVSAVLDTVERGLKDRLGPDSPGETNRA